MGDLFVRIIVNGVDHSVEPKPGCDCERCKNEGRRGDTSVSILAVKRIAAGQEEIVWHGLIDAGVGAVSNLQENLSAYEGDPSVDVIFLTHWHPGHTSGINQLCKDLSEGKHGRGLTPAPIPLWSRTETLKRLNSPHAYELGDYSQGSPRLLKPLNGLKENQPPGMLLPALGDKELSFEREVPGITIQPVTISHITADGEGNEPTYSTAGFIVTAPGGMRAGLLWDFDSRNRWVLDQPDCEAKKALQNLDYLFIDCNTWKQEMTANGRNTGHLAFENLRKYVTALQPRETILVHLDGHGDGKGNPAWGWSNAIWQENARSTWVRPPEPSSVRGLVSVLNVGEFIQLSTDEALMRWYYLCDDHAFEELYQKYYRHMVAYFRGHGRRNNSEDLAEEVLYRVVRTKTTGRGRFDPTQGSFKTWLYTIAKRIPIGAMPPADRPIGSPPAGGPNVIPPAGGPGMVPIGQNEPVHQPTQGRSIEIQDCLKRLSVSERVAVLLKNGVGFTFEEIDEILGTRPPTANRTYHSGIKKLQDCLGLKAITVTDEEWKALRLKAAELMFRKIVCVHLAEPEEFVADRISILPEPKVQRQAIEECMDHFYKETQTIIALWAQGKPLKNVASRLGFNEETVREKFDNAKKNIAKCLRAKGYEVEDAKAAVDSNENPRPPERIDD